MANEQKRKGKLVVWPDESEYFTTHLLPAILRLADLCAERNINLRCRIWSDKSSEQEYIVATGKGIEARDDEI